MNAVCPDAFADIVDVLERFSLSATTLLTPGGSRGPVPRTIDGRFEDLGWIEARVDTERKSYLIPRASNVQHGSKGQLMASTYQKGYYIDNVKDALAVDVEWNPKDGNLDRDLSAYRAWHREGLIVGAALITRVHTDTSLLTNMLWSDYVASNPAYAKVKQPVVFRTTTTANYEKALDRINRGDGGTCPLLLFGIGKRTWDGKPFNGYILKWSKLQGAYNLEHI